MVDQNKTEPTGLKMPSIIQLKTRQLQIKIRKISS